MSKLSKHWLKSTVINGQTTSTGEITFWFAYQIIWDLNKIKKITESNTLYYN